MIKGNLSRKFCMINLKDLVLFFQELLTYLAMFVKTQPDLFDGMLQIRIGLIMEVMAAEYARTTGLSGQKITKF